MADATKVRLREQSAALDPVRLLQEICAVQHTLAGFAASGRPETPTPLPVTDLATFLSSLSTAWASGEVRPTHRKQPGAAHEWRSRTDPFEHTWPVVLQWLEREPTVTTSEIMGRLAVMVPDVYASGAQLRTLQRRIKQWRAKKAKELIMGQLRRSVGESEATTTELG